MVNLPTLNRLRGASIQWTGLFLQCFRTVVSNVQVLGGRLLIFPNRTIYVRLSWLTVVSADGLQI